MEDPENSDGVMVIAVLSGGWSAAVVAMQYWRDTYPRVGEDVGTCLYCFPRPVLGTAWAYL